MESQKFTYAEFREMKEWKLEDKIERSNQLILWGLKQSKRPCIACSWGKDSVVLVHLVRNFCKNAVVVFHNTLVEYPETYNYRDEMLKLWDIKNYYETKPIEGYTFWSCVKKYGYPKFRMQTEKGKKAQAPKCCFYLKEKPAINFIKDFKIDTEFLGLQASESMARRLSFFREGEIFQSKKYGTTIVRPLMIWTDKDVWNYHAKFNIPKNPIYEKMPRCGCMPCTGFTRWKEVLAKANPAMYKFIARQKGMPTLGDFTKRKEDCNYGT